MKVRLTKYNRIEKGAAGVVVDVVPARAAFLIRAGLAVPVTVREQIEAPEKKAAPAKRETRAKAPAKKTTKTAKK
jgi:ribosomal protein L9